MVKRILVFARYHNGKQFYGTEKFAQRMYEHFDPENVKVDFIDFYFGYKLKNINDKLFGKNILSTKGNICFYRLGVFPLMIKIIRNGIDSILITTMEGYSLFASIILKIKKTKIFYFVHGIYKYELVNDKLYNEKLFWRIKYLLLEKAFFKLADSLILPSKLCDQQAKQYYCCDCKNTFVVPHGADEIFFQSKENYNSDVPLKIVYAGGYGRAQKGFDFMVHSIQKIKCPVDLFICGEIKDEKQFNSKIQPLNKNCKLHVEGMLNVKQLAELFKKCDIFLLPSQYESFSIVALEAMASSMVIIITAQAGLTEYLQNEKAAFIVDYGNSNSVFELISYIDKNRDILLQMGTNAQSFAKHYSWENTARRIKEILTLEI